MADIPRPPTPQVLMHRLPSPPAQDILAAPSKYLLIMLTPMEYPYKTMLADALSTNFSCKYYVGDSIHRFCEKAAGVGGEEPNVERYSRMWLSRMTKTGLLFPEESKPATAEFTGFGGGSTSTSRRGSISSVASEPESVGGGSVFDRPTTTAAGAKLASLRAALAKVEDEKDVQPVLLVLTHPVLETWSRQAIRTAMGEYGIGVIYLQLYEDEEDEDEELPVLQPLSQLSMTSFGAGKQRGWGNLTEEMKIAVDTNQPVDKQAAEVTEDVQFIIGIDD